MRSFFVKDNVVNHHVEQLCDKNICSKPIEYSRSYEKGKSFNCTEYIRGEDYYNNDFVQDFVIYDHKLYACIKDTTDVPGESKNWALVVRSTNLIDATATINNKVGIPAVEVITIGDGLDKQFEFKFYNLKGDKGERGEQGIQGIQGIQGEKGDQGPRGFKGDKGDKGDRGEKGERGEIGLRGPEGKRGLKGDKGDRGERGIPGPQGLPGPRGEKGESGNGNFEIGTGSPPPKGFVNDIYLDINTGNFYKFSNVWENVGQISINGSDINLENYYTKPEIDEYIEWQDD